MNRKLLSILSVTLLLLLFIFSFPSWKKNGVTTYTLTIASTPHKLLSGHLQLGTNKNPKGEVLDANSLYFIRNGKPWFPVMGEFHFSRYPKAQWEESILKMKAAGINVIATYVFWIYHEEEEGKWNWSGNRDLNYFASLCAKNNIYLFVRIGPWCHGEVRNGGFPDWLLQQTKTRRNDSAYLQQVQQFFGQINNQLKGYYFKEGGPVIGAQIENEYRFNNPSGLAHILTLKKMAREAGIDVPYYTATGWPGSNLKQNELIPVWGAYPEAPWDKSTDPLKPSVNYLFDSLRSDLAIGSDILGTEKDTADYSGYRYPYATAEMGGGNQLTYHRRPIIEAKDVTALAYVKTGSGANLMGYYMFHGGSNAVGKLSTLQESKATHYPNDYPLINYDFYAPIGEWGQIRPSYHAFKTFHLFLQNFGDKLATTYAYFPDQKPSGPTDITTLRWAVRANNNRGFIFINNYQRQVATQDLRDVQLNIRNADGTTLQIPQEPVTIKNEAQLIWPFHMDMEGAHLQYATAQPLCRLEGKEPLFVFFAPEDMQPEYVLEKNAIKNITAVGGTVRTNDSTYRVAITEPGTRCLTQIQLTNGKSIKILTLTHQQAMQTWKATIWGTEHLFISGQQLIFTENGVRIQSEGKASMQLAVYPKPEKITMGTAKVVVRQDGLFTNYQLTLPEKSIKIVWYEDERLHQSSSLGEKNLVNDSVTSLPVYGPFLSAISTARYWKVLIPKTALQGVGDAFVTLDYTGDTQAIYLDGNLIADDFYAGLPMRLSIKQFAPQILGKELVVLVTPLTNDKKIYFESGVREPLLNKIVAELKNVSAVPLYEIWVKKSK